MQKLSLLSILAAVCLLSGVAAVEYGGSVAGSSAAEATSAAPAGVRVVGLADADHVPTRDALTLDDAIELALQSRDAMQEVRDYVALFTKRESINGRLRKQVMEMKLRSEPFSVYLRYQSKKEAGRQAIYVAGRNDDCLLVKDVGLKGLAGTVRLGLQNPLVTAENRYPVTHLGIGNVIDIVLTTWERESELDGVRPLVEIAADVRFGEVTCREVVVTYDKYHPELEYQKVRVSFDSETKLPIHAQRYGWPHETGEEPPLLEEYIYHDVKLNVGLSDADFDPAHYGF